MNALTDLQILTIWEQGRERGPVEQAVLMLSEVEPEANPRELARLPLGQRDIRLFQARKATIGNSMTATSDCPACGQSIRFGVSVDDIMGMAGSIPEGEQFSFTFDAYTLDWRLLDSRDLASVEGFLDPSVARQRLVERSVITARSAGEEIPLEALPEKVITALGEAMEELDPMAYIPLDLSCEACGHRWLPPFDIASFLWRELHNRAECLMTDIQTLATTYGWSEAEILAISPARRRFYLENPPAENRPGEDLS